MASESLFIIDGLNWLNRFYHGMPVLNNAQGVPTHAVHGWMTNIWKIWRDWKPDHVIAVFDQGRCARRVGLLPEYKGNRDTDAAQEHKDGLAPQIEEVVALCPDVGIGTVRIPNVEADDVIFTLAKSWSYGKVWVLSGDKDLGAVIGGNVTQIKFTGQPVQPWKELDREGLKENIGVYPEQVPDWLALVGDVVDNIPGVAGVGAKTASAWLSAYGTLEGVFENYGDLKPKRFATLFADLSEQAKVIVRREVTKLYEIDPTIIDIKLPTRDGTQRAIDRLYGNQLNVAAKMLMEQRGVKPRFALPE